MFLYLVLTHLGHEHQDLNRPCDIKHVHIDWALLPTLMQKSCGWPPPQEVSRHRLYKAAEVVTHPTGKWRQLKAEPGITHEKIRGNFYHGLGACPPTNLPPKILNIETKICAIWGILKANLKKSSTLKFIMNISFVPSVWIHRVMISIFIPKKVSLSIFFPQNTFFPMNFGFQFRENPHFHDKFLAL